MEVEVAGATRGHFEATIDEDGKTRLRDRYLVSAPLAGVVTRISLRAGRDRGPQGLQDGRLITHVGDRRPACAGSPAHYCLGSTSASTLK